MNTQFIIAKKDLKPLKKNLSIQIYDDEFCKIEVKSVNDENNPTHNRNLSKESNNLQINSGSLFLSQTVSNNSLQTFKNSLNNSISHKMSNFSISVNEDKTNIKASSHFGNKDELELCSIQVEEDPQSQDDEVDNKSFISNYSIVAVNKQKQFEKDNKSILCTPNTICNYYLPSNDVTPNKLFYNNGISNPTNNAFNQTDAFNLINSISARSSNQDLKTKITKNNFLTNINNNQLNGMFNQNGSNFSNTNSVVLDDIVNENSESNCINTRNFCDKRTPIKYTKSQLRSGEKDYTKANESKSDSSNKNPSSSLNEILKINSKPIDQRLSIIAKEIKKNLNISEIEIEREEQKINGSYSKSDAINGSDVNSTDSNIYEKKNLDNVIDNKKTFLDAKNLNFAFEQIKNGNEFKEITEVNKIENIKSNELTINILKNQNFSFDITYNKSVINKINEQAQDNNMTIINTTKCNIIKESEKETEAETLSIVKDNKNEIILNKNIEESSINLTNRMRRIDNYSFGSSNNTSMNNLTNLCNNLQQNRTNLIDKISKNLKKFNLHPDLKSLFKKNKSHKEFSNNIIDKNIEKSEVDENGIDVVQPSDDKEQSKKIEINEINQEKNLKNKPEKNIIIFSSEKYAVKSRRQSPNATTDEKRINTTLPSTGKSNQLVKQGSVNVEQNTPKELSHFEIQKFLTKNDSKTNLNSNNMVKQESTNKLGLNIKEIVIKTKDKDANKKLTGSTTNYFSPGETKKNSKSPRYNTKKTQSIPASQMVQSKQNAETADIKKQKFFDMIKLYSIKGQGAFSNKGISPINNKYNSFNKSLSRSKLNGTSFVSNNNSYAKSTSRNNSKNKTIEVTYQADQTSDHHTYTKIPNSVNKTKDSKLGETIINNDSHMNNISQVNNKKIFDVESCRKIADNSHDIIKSNNILAEKKTQSKISQFKNKNLIPPTQINIDKTNGIIKSMKNINKNEDDNLKSNTDRVTNPIDHLSYSNSNIINKIKLNNEIKNIQIEPKKPSENGKMSSNEKENLNMLNNALRNNVLNSTENNKTRESNVDATFNNNSNNLIKTIIPNNSIVNDEIHPKNFQLTQSKKNIKVISNFSNYTKKKSPVAESKTKVNQSNAKINKMNKNEIKQINTIALNNYNTISRSQLKEKTLNLIQNPIVIKNVKNVEDYTHTSLTSRNTLGIGPSIPKTKPSRDNSNNSLNKQIVSSKIKYLSGDDDFVFFDE